MAQDPTGAFNLLDNATDTAELPEPPPPTEEEAKLVGKLVSAFRRCDQYRSDYATEWAYYEDALFSSQRGTELRVNDLNNDIFNVTNLDTKDLTARYNHLIVVYNAWLGKMTRSQPRRTVAPGAGSLDQMFGTRAADRLIEIATEATKLNLKLDQAKADIPWGSNGYLELSWDPMAGGQVGQCEACGYEDSNLVDGEICPHCEMAAEEYQQQVAMMGQAPMGQPGLPGVTQPLPPPPPAPAPMTVGYKGGPRVDHLDPRTVYLQVGIDRWENLQYYFTRVPLPTVTIREMFPESADKVRKEPVYPANGSVYNIDARTGNIFSAQISDQAFLYKYTEKPTKAFPKGRIVYMCNNRILRAIDNPYYKFRRLPLFHFGWLRVPGTLYTLPPIANAYQLQKQLDQAETKTFEHMVLCVAPKWVVPQNSGISADEITATTAQVLTPRRNQAEAVRLLNPPPMPSELFARPQDLADKIRSVFGVTPQEMANINTDPNGRYAAIAQAASDQTVGHIIRAHADEEADIVRCFLILYQQFMPKEDSYAKFNEDFLEEYSFADLNFNPHDLSVIIETEDGLSQNPAMRLEQIATLTQLGAFGPVGQPGFNFGLFMKAARLKIPGMLPDRSDSSVMNANAIIKMLENGEEWQPQPEDNAEVFTNVLTQWLQVNSRRPSYTLKNPALIERVREVNAYYQQIFAQTMPAQAMSGGGGPGGPSQPGSGLSAPGGSPNEGNSVDPNQGDLSQNAQGIVEGADAQAEATARGGQPHEAQPF